MSQMIEVKTAEMSGPALRWAVAQAEGLELEIYPPEYGAGHRIALRHGPSWMEAYRPDEDWRQCGKLIDKHGISVDYRPPLMDGGTAKWYAIAQQKCFRGEGESPRVAACRAIVAAKLGDTVTIPAELLP